MEDETKQSHRSVFISEGNDFYTLVFGKDWAVNWTFEFLWFRWHNKSMNAARSDLTKAVHRNYLGRDSGYTYAIPMVLMEGDNYEGP